MSRAMVSRVLLHVIALFFSSFAKASSNALPNDCTEFDINELEDYISKLNFENVPTVDMMIGEFKCPVTALPFGALKSDWARLLLLQRAQPEESIFQEKLGRLFRILLIAYFRMEERFDVTEFGVEATSSLNVSPTYEGAISVNSTEETKEPNISISTSKMADGIDGSSTPPTIFEKEIFFTERTNFVNGNTTMKNGNDIVYSLSNDISTVPINSSYTSSWEIVQKETVIAPFPTNSTIFASTTGEPRKYTSPSNNYMDNYILNEKVSLVNAVTETNRETNSEETSSSNRETISTTSHFVRDKSTASNFTRDEPARNNFITDESNEISEMKHSTSNDRMVTGTGLISGASIVSAFDISARASTLDPIGSVTKKETDETMDSILATNILNNTEDKNRETSGRGDHPVSYDFPNFVDSKENEVKLSTVQYRDIANLNFTELENTSSSTISTIKNSSKTNDWEQIFRNGTTAGSIENFNRKSPNIFRVFERAPRYFSNSTFLPNKIRKPTMYRNIPMDNNFWKYIVTSRTVTLTTSTTKSTLTLESEEDGASNGSSTNVKKRGNLNTDIEKSFRWFYNFAHENGKYSSDNAGDHPGIRIECNKEVGDNGK